MDLSHLVHALMGRLLHFPALHFAALGSLLFVLVSPQGSAPPPRLLIPTSRIDTALEEYQSLSDHPMTQEDKKAVVRAVVEQELLYAYARRLGMGKDAAVERRLAQIATFVADNPHEAKTTEERADEAAMLGLGEGDLVVRRIMIDGAKRLIRAAVLVREPTEAALESELREHAEEFLIPARWRLSQVVVDNRLHGKAEEDARRLLERLRKDAVSPSDAAQHGDAGFVAANQPLLPGQELERRFGHRFVAALAGLPVGSWEGPIPSRFGFHLVYVEESVPPRTPPLAEVRSAVRARLREKLADQWLALRLAQLRSEFAVEIVGAQRENYQL